MRYVEAGGVRLSALGLGTRHFGSRRWGGAGAFAFGPAQAIIRRALDLGVNLIDTAEIYGTGQSERIVGRAVSDDRDRAFLATKVAGMLPTQDVVVASARASARRLGVEKIDLYQLHWPSRVLPQGSAMAGMGSLLAEETIARVGVSQHSLEQWRLAEQSLGSAVISDQVHYSLLHRGPEEDLIPWAAGSDRLIIAYSPLEHGLLSGCYDGFRRPGGLRRITPGFAAPALRAVAPVIAALREVGSKYGASPSQVALAWTTRLGPVIALAGASSVEQLEANVAAMDLELDSEDDARLEEVSNRYSSPKRPWDGLLSLS